MPTLGDTGSMTASFRLALQQLQQKLRPVERIESGMRRAVNLWRTSQYWADRAAGALRHAKYKERPAVRARRIKGLEADQRRHERDRDRARTFLKLWEADGLTLERAKAIANHDHISQCFPLSRYPRELPASQYEGQMSLWSALDGVIPPETARSIAVNAHHRTIERADRWLEHLANRLAYERTMLAEAGGIVTDEVGPQVGGACRCWASPGYGRGWSFIKKVNKVSVTVEDNWGNGGRNFARTIPFDKLAAVLSKAEVGAARAAGRLHEVESGLGFYLAEPVRAKPAPEPAEDAEFERRSPTTMHQRPGQSSALAGTPRPGAPFWRQSIRARYGTVASKVRIRRPHRAVDTGAPIVFPTAAIQP
jgi:hypothetical protein